MRYNTITRRPDMILLIVDVAIVLFAMGGAGAQDRDGSKDDYGYEDFSDGERYDYDYDGSYERGGDECDNSCGGLFERFQDGTCNKADMELLMEDDDIREGFSEYGDF